MFCKLCRRDDDEEKRKGKNKFREMKWIDRDDVGRRHIQERRGTARLGRRCFAYTKLSWNAKARVKTSLRENTLTKKNKKWNIFIPCSFFWYTIHWPRLITTSISIDPYGRDNRLKFTRYLQRQASSATITFSCQVQQRRSWSRPKAKKRTIKKMKVTAKSNLKCTQAMT